MIGCYLPVSSGSSTYESCMSNIGMLFAHVSINGGGSWLPRRMVVTFHIKISLGSPFLKKPVE